MVASPEQKGYNNMIYIEPCAGLGNRLLGLFSAYAVAKQLDRKLTVVWKREVGCNIRADELFDLPVEVIEISENGYKKEPIAQIKGDMTKKKLRKAAGRFLECDDMERIKNEEGYEALFEVIKAEPSIYIKAFGPICEVDAKSYEVLKPSRSIEKKGAGLFGRLDAHTVGVHVRRTDHTEAIANSPLSLFVDKMKAELAADADAKFFVATDDETVKAELREELPEEKLIFNEKGIIDRNSKQGLEDAFIEMLALSRCKKILGSYNSTFSLLPSYIGNIPLEVIAQK